MKQFTATANDEGVRLSRFVQSVTRDFPTSLLYKSFRNKRIKVNGRKGAPRRPPQGRGTSLSCTSTTSFFRRKAQSPRRKRLRSSPASPR